VGTDQVWFDPSPTGCASTDVCEPVSQGSTTAATTRAEFPGNSTIQITRIEESHAFRCAPDESATRPRGCRRGSVGCRLWRLDPSCPSDEGDNTSTDYRVGHRVGHLVGVGHTVHSGHNLVSSDGVTTPDSVRDSIVVSSTPPWHPPKVHLALTRVAPFKRLRGLCYSQE
jgi:hypothetical protein